MVADEEKREASENPYPERQTESGFKSFMKEQKEEIKQEFKQFGQEVKTIFGKASAFGKKVMVYGLIFAVGIH